jgi:hypothetical protein
MSCALANQLWLSEKFAYVFSFNTIFYSFSLLQRTAIPPVHYPPSSAPSYVTPLALLLIARAHVCVVCRVVFGYERGCVAHVQAGLLAHGSSRGACPRSPPQSSTLFVVKFFATPPLTCASGLPLGAQVLVPRSTPWNLVEVVITADGYVLSRCVFSDSVCACRVVGRVVGRVVSCRVGYGVVPVTGECVLTRWLRGVDQEPDDPPVRSDRAMAEDHSQHLRPHQQVRTTAHAHASPHTHTFSLLCAPFRRPAGCTCSRRTIW